MYLIQLVYTTQITPGQSEDSTLKGTTTVGNWAFITRSMELITVLKGFNSTWAAPLIAQAKAGTISAWDNMLLNTMKQARAILYDLELRGGDKAKLQAGTYQYVEKLNHGLMSLVHNITIVIIDDDA